MTYRFYFKDGTTTVWEATNLVDALNKSGYTNEDLSKVAYWEENEPNPTKQWDYIQNKWV